MDTENPRNTRRAADRLKGWLVGAGPLVALLVLLGTTGGDRPSPAGADDSAEVEMATVQRDLADLEAEGTLRVLLRNSSSSYFVLRGEEYGFEFELARAFARSRGLRLQVVLPDSQLSLVSQLNRGDADLVAAPLLPGQFPGYEYALTEPYLESALVVVTPSDGEALSDSLELEGLRLAVRAGSAGELALRQLGEAGIGVEPVLVDPGSSTEEVLDGVELGLYDGALVHGHIAQALLAVNGELQVALNLGEPAPLRWATRTNSPELAAAASRFLREHHRALPSGELRHSGLYNMLWGRYFRDIHQIRSRESHPFRLARTGRLSPFDDLFREHAARQELDWLLVASLSFQESRFDPEAISWVGAVGLMQLMPRSFRATTDSLLDPVTNVALGTAELRRLLQHYDYLPATERLRFALAAYNAGVGHLDDARILAMNRGRNPNVWEGSVRDCLLMLSRPEHHRNARYGYVRATETVSYVDAVLRRYALFRRILRPEVEEPMTAWLEPAAGEAPRGE